MTITRTLRVAGLVTAGALVFVAWGWRYGDERAISVRLDALAAAVNTNAGEGLSAAAHAAEIGGYFTEDAVVDLGEGTARIEGRATIIGMAARLRPRTAAVRLRFDDVGVKMLPGAISADVTLTASFVQRTGAAGEETMDAREFALSMTKTRGAWQIARIAAVDTLRQEGR